MSIPSPDPHTLHRNPVPCCPCRVIPAALFLPNPVVLGGGAPCVASVSLIAVLVSWSSLVTGQEASQPGPKPARVVVTARVLEAEVGQQLQFSAVGYDEMENKLDAKPSAWFASPFDLAYSDESGNVTFTAAR